MVGRYLWNKSSLIHWLSNAWSLIMFQYFFYFLFIILLFELFYCMPIITINVKKKKKNNNSNTIFLYRHLRTSTLHQQIPYRHIVCKQVRTEPLYMWVLFPVKIVLIILLFIVWYILWILFCSVNFQYIHNSCLKYFLCCCLIHLWSWKKNTI